MDFHGNLKISGTKANVTSMTIARQIEMIEQAMRNAKKQIQTDDNSSHDQV